MSGEQRSRVRQRLKRKEHASEAQCWITKPHYKHLPRHDLPTKQTKQNRQHAHTSTKRDRSDGYEWTACVYVSALSCLQLRDDTGRVCARGKQREGCLTERLHASHNETVTSSTEILVAWARDRGGGTLGNKEKRTTLSPQTRCVFLVEQISVKDGNTTTRGFAQVTTHCARKRTQHRRASSNNKSPTTV